MKVELDLEEYLRFFDMKEYKPRAAKHEVDEDYVAVLIEDDAKNYPDTWVFVRYRMGDLETEFCQDIFYLRNWEDRRAKAFQEIATLDDGYLWSLCSECAEDYVIEKDLLKNDREEW